MNAAMPGNESDAQTGTPWDTAAEALGGRVFHIGIEIGGNTTECVLLDPAAPGAAVICRTAKELSARSIPADRVMAGVAELAQAAGLGQRELLAWTTRFCPGPGKAQLEHKVILIQVIRARAPWQDQQALWRKFLMVSHEVLRLPGDPRQVDYRKRLGSGSHDALTEPGADVLAVWTAGLRSAGAGSGAGASPQAGRPSGTGTPGVPAGLPHRPEGDPAGAAFALRLA